MPLQMGGIETARPQTLVWNPGINAEVQDAIERKDELLKQGFLLREETEGKITLDPPEKDSNIGVFRVLSQNGDDRIIWDRRSKDQVKEAFEKFKEFLRKGYTAYVTRDDGKPGHKISEFNPGLEEVILDLVGANGIGREATMVPKTVPG